MVDGIAWLECLRAGALFCTWWLAWLALYAVVGYPNQVVHHGGDTAGMPVVARYKSGCPALYHLNFVVVTFGVWCPG